MDAGNTTNTPRRRFATRGRIWSLVALIATGYVVLHVSGWAAPTETAAQQRGRASAIAGNGKPLGHGDGDETVQGGAGLHPQRRTSQSGTWCTRAPASSGRMALLPGNYEVKVKAKDLVSDVQKLALKAGDNPTSSCRCATLSANQAAGGALNEAPSSTLTFAELRRNLSGQRAGETGGRTGLHDLPRRELPPVAARRTRTCGTRASTTCRARRSRARRHELRAGAPCLPDLDVPASRGRIARTSSPTW